MFVRTWCFVNKIKYLCCIHVHRSCMTALLKHLLLMILSCGLKMQHPLRFFFDMEATWSSACKPWTIVCICFFMHMLHCTPPPCIELHDIHPYGAPFGATPFFPWLSFRTAMVSPSLFRLQIIVPIHVFGYWCYGMGR